MKATEMRGARFGRLTVIERAFNPDPKKKALWSCLCDCGKTMTATGILLRLGKVKSCGCYRVDEARKLGLSWLRHGEASGGTMSTEYRTWEAMKRRCLNAAHASYADYGGRGITVCERWLTFENFLSDMGRRPAGMSLDRTENARGYEPGNCRWATSRQQNRNKRGNRLITIDGVTKPLVEWLESASVTNVTFHRRMRAGMSERDALFSPAKTRKNRQKKKQQGVHQLA